jgi:hypothetical protein
LKPENLADIKARAREALRRDPEAADSPGHTRMLAQDVLDLARDIEAAFYILSLKHTGDGDRVLTWWAPGGRGYLYRLEMAGRFTAEEIAGEAWRYNDGVNAIAIPRAIVEARAVAVCSSRLPVLVRSPEEKGRPITDHVVPGRWLAEMKKHAARLPAKGGAS